MTHVRLAAAQDVLAGALRAAYELRVAKNKTGKAGASGGGATARRKTLRRKRS